ncbi:glycosyltransferase family 2 protein [Geomonas sp. RF6]|uniref:glycosyltransferase family 2 protein n=1 Tax=Geomonas sp. RF6 TaxID=2897342 RepID=UPI001E406FC6|nr:glycosyltransferase family 2 protein [Geomonas sp. RF6]UFS71048.1 glycosyltransferase family 2 protein [Geomonas sp. RF6]
MIEILLSTFNGERYLAQQLDSVLLQECREWRLTARDDGSSDGTVTLLQRYAQQSGGRIRISDDSGENLGACRSFARLLERSTAQYLMFCDQDDVWFPGKVARTFAKLKELEEKYGKETPLLVFSDASVADADLALLAPSMWEYQHSAPEIATRMNRLLLMNPANGCTMLFNRALAEAALPVPAEALMHDSWLVLVACALGKVGYLPEPTLLYRQHGGNESVTKRWGSAYVAAQLANLGAARHYQTLLQRQAGALLERYRGEIAPSAATLLSAYAGLGSRGILGKRIDILRHRLFYVGAVRNIGWLLTC